MKTLVNKFCSIALIFTLATTFYSCEPEDPRDRYEQTDYLCSRRWADEWIENGVRYYQEFTFYGNYTGREYVYQEDVTGRRSESTYSFDWDWNGHSSIYLRYTNGSSYMNHISLGGNELYCVLNGEQVTFRGI